MPRNENIHTQMLWTLRDYFARDGRISKTEQAILDMQEGICQRTSAAHGLLYGTGVPRAVKRQNPDWLRDHAAD